MLEPLDAALARGARIHAEVIGHGNSNDAFHVAAPHPESRGLIQMMSRGLASAGIAPEEVGYINAHGTSTPQGDAAETFAIKQIFGEHAYDLAGVVDEGLDGPPVRRRRRVRDGHVHPCLSRRDPAPDAALPRRRSRVRSRLRDGRRAADGREVAMSNSIGLGGHNGCVLVRRYDGE